MMTQKTQTGYNMGHPWHYVLGGPVPTPKEIRAQATARGYQGYMADRIRAASNKSEPQRSEALRAIKAKVMEELRSNLSCYRELARELYKFRCDNPPSNKPHQCHYIHTSMSLKYAHIYNDFGHLHFLDSLPEQQGDLFD